MGQTPGHCSTGGNNTRRNAVLNRVLPGFNFLMGTEAQPQLIINALHAVTDVKIFPIRHWW